MKFSIWYNEELDFLSLIKKYKDNISTVYFPLFYKIIWSWRTIIGRTKDIKDYYKKVIPLITLCKNYWIDTDLILNSSCDWINTWNIDYWKRIITYIKPLKKSWLTTITLANLWYIENIREEFPDIKICNSLNVDWVDSVERALNLKNMWVDILTLETSINYDISLIKKIKEMTWLKIKIFINDSCISNCPFDRQHASMLAHLVEPDSLDWIKWACWKIYKKNKRKFFRVPFIRPEDLHNYNFIDYFKLTTRDRSTEFIDNLLYIYISWSYDWNLLDLLEFDFSEVTDIKYIDNKKLWKLWFFEDMLKCPKSCDICTNCDKFF
jgi:hypothetical protein